MYINPYMYMYMNMCTLQLCNNVKLMATEDFQSCSVLSKLRMAKTGSGM